MKLNCLNLQLKLSPCAKDGWRACFSKFTTVHCYAKTNPFTAGLLLQPDQKRLNWEDEHSFLISRDILSCIYLLIYIFTRLYLIFYIFLWQIGIMQNCVAEQEGQWQIRTSKSFKDLVIAYMRRCSLFLLFHSFLEKHAYHFIQIFWFNEKMSMVYPSSKKWQNTFLATSLFWKQNQNTFFKVKQLY